LPKVKVIVRNTPVRYNGEDFEPGDEFVIDADHFIDSLFEKGEEVDDDGDKSFTIEQLKDLSDEDLQDVKIDQLKAALKEVGIEFKSNATRAVLINLIPTE
jgi:ferredoxin-fold anticodon binding domain-containing protein